MCNWMQPWGATLSCSCAAWLHTAQASCLKQWSRFTTWTAQPAALFRTSFKRPCSSMHNLRDMWPTTRAMQPSGQRGVLTNGPIPKEE